MSEKRVGRWRRAAVTGAVQRWLAQRDRASWVISRALFLRLLGFVYLVAFVSLAVQITGLVGEHGILPIGRFLQAAHDYYGSRVYPVVPTVLWIAHSDAMLLVVCWAGAAAGAVVAAGIAPLPLLTLAWLLYLSISVAGQTFLNFQWDGLLLETGFLALLYAPTGWRARWWREPASPAARWLIWFLLFRLMFLSGITKLLSGDPTWRNLTALNYHYFTQPLPTPAAWYAAQLPQAWQKASTLFVYCVELVAPWFVLAPLRGSLARRTACALLIGLQLVIALTGNYGFFNLLTLVLCAAALDDELLLRLAPQRLRRRLAALVQPGAAAPPAADTPAALTPLRSASPARSSTSKRMLAGVLAALATVTLVREMVATASGAVPPWINSVLSPVAPFRSINGYGLFRVMTTQRPEIVMEGSRDTVTWQAYEFRFKPGAPQRPPRLIEPYMPRLDWQMWFGALDPRGNGSWLAPFMERVLEGSPAVLRLLARNPFPDAPPQYLRLVLYRYRFSTRAERRASGAWWQRELLGTLTAPLTLEQLR